MNHMKINKAIVIFFMWIYLISLIECSSFFDLIHNNKTKLFLSLDDSTGNKIEFQKLPFLNENAEENENNTDEQTDNSIFDSSVESFFDFANRRLEETQNTNKLLFEKAISNCQHAPNNQELTNRINDITARSSLNVNIEKCLVGSLTLNDIQGRTSDRLFIYDSFMIGLISNVESSLKLYSFNMVDKSLNFVRAKYFKNEVPFDACTDKEKNIYIVFPDQNKIGKYSLNQKPNSFKAFVTNNNNHMNKLSNKTRIGIKELISIKDYDIAPSAISCHEDLIYVSERASKQIRVYDKLLRFVRVLNLNDLIVSPHRAISINSNLRVVLDGSDGLALFENPVSLVPSRSFTSRRKFTLLNKNNKINVCHIYESMGCLEDLHIYPETKTTTSIFTVNNCNQEIVQFTHSKEHQKLQLSRKYQISIGKPISAKKNSFGHLFILTDMPRKILILDTRECHNNNN